MRSSRQSRRDCVAQRSFHTGSSSYRPALVVKQTRLRSGRYSSFSIGGAASRGVHTINGRLFPRLLGVLPGCRRIICCCALAFCRCRCSHSLRFFCGRVVAFFISGLQPGSKPIDQACRLCADPLIQAVMSRTVLHRLCHGQIISSTMRRRRVPIDHRRDITELSGGGHGGGEGRRIM